MRSKKPLGWIFRPNRSTRGGSKGQMDQNACCSSRRMKPELEISVILTIILSLSYFELFDSTSRAISHIESSSLFFRMQMAFPLLLTST